MDRIAAVSLAIFMLIIGAIFYPPLASLIDQAIRVLLWLGIPGGLLYLIFRYPWDAILWTFGIIGIVGPLLIAFKVFEVAGFLAGAVAYGGSAWIMSKIAVPLGKWYEKKKS